MAGEKSTAYSGQLLALYFNGTAIPNIATNTATSPITNVYVSLHTADPTAAGNQSTSEVSYTGYARVAVARTTAGWAVSGASCAPVSAIVFPSPTGSAGQVATFAAVGQAASGATEFQYVAPISPSITITLNLPPTLTTASAFTEA